VAGVSETYSENRIQLEAERTRLLRRIDELTAGGEIELDFDDDFADRGQVASEQGEYSALADTFRSQLNRVEHALARIADGSYGTCEVCGEPIAEARLEALPATSRCIDHAAGSD
jgi:RNA polymerase-binding transcription factor DksA